uniref:Uncharacterized protein n=1 Tax=Arundo donax TaxID=35708 RepID=A0A0A8YFI4_ARUDO
MEELISWSMECLTKDEIRVREAKVIEFVLSKLGHRSIGN